MTELQDLQNQHINNLYMENTDELIQKIIGASYKVYNTLGTGFLEKVYEKALCIKLKKEGLKVERQYPVSVYYEKEKVGDYYADLYVKNRIIIELKSVECLSIAHEKQLVNYLSATNIDDGLLINFSIEKVQIKRKFRVYKKQRNNNNILNDLL